MYPSFLEERLSLVGLQAEETVVSNRLSLKHWFRCALVKGRGERRGKYLLIVIFCSWRNWNINLEELTSGKTLYCVRIRSQGNQLPFLYAADHYICLSTPDSAKDLKTKPPFLQNSSSLF